MLHQHLPADERRRQREVLALAGLGQAPPGVEHPGKPGHRLEHRQVDAMRDQEPGELERHRAQQGFGPIATPGPQEAVHPPGRQGKVQNNRHGIGDQGGEHGKQVRGRVPQARLRVGATLVPMATNGFQVGHSSEAIRSPMYWRIGR